LRGTHTCTTRDDSTALAEVCRVLASQAREDSANFF